MGAYRGNRYGERMDETYFCSKVAYTNKLELLKWAREEKKCEWDEWTINTAAYQGNLEMVKYCVANKCPIDECACANAAQNGHLECLKYLREEVKAPWDSGNCRLGGCKMVISTYSNILLSVSLINIRICVRACSRERPLRLFEVLARNRQSAVGLLGGTKSAREQPPRVSTIPPRQQLSITIWLAIRKRRVTRRDRIRIRIKLNVITERERGREREEKEIQNERFGESTLPGLRKRNLRRNENETSNRGRDLHATS